MLLSRARGNSYNAKVAYNAIRFATLFEVNPLIMLLRFQFLVYFRLLLNGLRREKNSAEVQAFIAQAFFIAYFTLTCNNTLSLSILQ